MRVRVPPPAPKLGTTMSKGQHIEKTAEETAEEFSDNLQMLKNSCQLYDDGHYIEASRIASAVFNFVFNNDKRSPPLIKRIGKRVKLLNTAYPVDPKNLISSMTLVIMRFGKDFEYAPALNEQFGTVEKEWISISEWENQVVIHRPKPPLSYTRKNLIYLFRNCYGGAHWSKGIDDAAFELKKRNPAGWVFRNSDGEEKVPKYGPEYASIRQIGHEVICSIENLQIIDAQE